MAKHGFFRKLIDALGKKNPSGPTTPAASQDPTPAEAINAPANTTRTRPMSTSANNRTDRASLVYAKALLELADESGQTDGIAHEAGEIIELLDAQPELVRLFSSPAISQTHRAQAIQRIFEPALDPTLYKFLQIVSAKGRLASLPSILAAFAKLLDERRGVVDVQATVAAPLPDDQADALAQAVGQSLGKTATLTQSVDPSLIGGFRLRVGDQLIDASVATRLDTLRRNMADAGRAKARQIASQQA